MTQAEERTTLDDELEKVHVVSEGRNPNPVTEIPEPTGLLDELREITGSEETLVRIALAENTSTQHARSPITRNLNQIRLDFPSRT
jgi:hypothetical protein